MSLDATIPLYAAAALQPDETIPKIAINVATFLSALCLIFLVGFVATRFTQKTRDGFRDFFGTNVFFLLWLVPATAMALSLIFSEYFNWAPCKLCWYQRACIYPLVIIMLVYYFKRTALLRRIGYVFAGICPFISAYHVWIELKGEDSSFCSAEVSCAAPWFKALGFLTTPGMALIATVTILVLLYMSSQVESQDG